MSLKQRDAKEYFDLAGDLLDRAMAREWDEGPSPALTREIERLSDYDRYDLIPKF